MRDFLPQALEGDSDAKDLASILRSLQYLCAERTGPRDVYPLNNSFEYPNVGVNGENTPWVLHQFAEMTPMPGLLIESATKNLQRQVEAWTQEFFPAWD